MMSYFDFLGPELALIAERHYELSKEVGCRDVSFTDEILDKLSSEFSEKAVRMYEQRDRAYHLRMNKPVSCSYSFKGKEHKELQCKYNYLISGGSSEMYSRR